MSRTNKIKWKRLLNDLSYLYEEVELIEDLEKETNNHFESYYREYCAQNNIDIDKLNQENHEKICEIYEVIAPEEPLSTPEYEGCTELSHNASGFEEVPLFDEHEDALFKKLHEDFHKLFKKIAMQLHPDRIGNYVMGDEQKRKRSWDFSKAKSCLDKKRYFHLVKIAQKYNILVPEDYSLQIKWFRKERSKISAEIERKKRTYNYKFSECHSEEEKDILVRGFIHQVFQINV